jgi:DNA-binding MarR family transcriptional regulator
MDNNIKESIESMAKEIRSQALTMKVDTFLSYLYTSDIINKFLYLMQPSQPVSRPGFNILHNLILNNGTMLPSEISKKTMRSKYSVTRAIDTLEKQGMVERQPIGLDRRTRRVNITRKGLDVVNNATIDSRERLSQDIFGAMNSKQTEDFNDILKILRKHVLTLIDTIVAEKSE